MIRQQRQLHDRLARVIFLDVDGVLNNESSFSRHVDPDQAPAGEGKTNLDIMDEDCLARLARIVEATSAGVVVTSTWRLQPRTLAVLTEGLQRHGVPPGAMLGCTRDLEGSCLGDRAREIRAWLQEERQSLLLAMRSMSDGGWGWFGSFGAAVTGLWQRLRRKQSPTTGGGVSGQALVTASSSALPGHLGQPPAWVAIDDMDLAAMEPEFMDGHFVRTSMATGLTDAHAGKAIEILLAGRSIG